jgi:hypothetical protein
MRTHRRSALCATIERALLARDRREIASVERLMKALRVEARPHRMKTRHHKGR